MDWLKAMQTVEMREMYLVKMTGNHWETLKEILMENRLVHSTGEQKELLMEVMSDTSLVC